MKYIGAIDQGTTSTRFIIFDENGKIVWSNQLEHKQYFPKPGWVEHDPYEIWDNTVETIVKSIRDADINISDMAAVGITNQRETVIAWNPNNGKVYYNAIVWQDLRGSVLIEKIRKKYGEDKIKKLSGLVLSPYFSASKILFKLHMAPAVQRVANGLLQSSGICFEFFKIASVTCNILLVNAHSPHDPPLVMIM